MTSNRNKQVEEKASPLAAGDRVGAYEILEPLGAGGMGIVYRARDSRIGREAAVKVLSPVARSDDERLYRFISEAKLVAMLNHPNILTIYEVNDCEAGLCIVSELVEGKTLREVLSSGAMTVSDALDVVTQAASGLSKAHRAGIVHRDIKPENLMLTPDGLVKILDFGLAKALDPDALGLESAAANITAADAIVGTAGYIAPEQLYGQPHDARSDVYALGVVAYELLAGKPPFSGKTVAEILHATLDRVPEPVARQRDDLPEQLSELIEDCMARDREQRPRNCVALAERLKSIGLPSEDRGGAGRATSPQGRRGRGLLGAMASAVAGVVPRLGRRSSGWGPGRGSEAKPSRKTASALSPTSPPSARSTSSPEAGAIGVAVLPIDDHSGEPTLAEARAGRILTDAFLHILIDVPGFYVVSPFLLAEAANELGRPLADAVDDPRLAREIGARVAASAVLTGSLDRLVDGYVLGAAVTELTTGKVLKSYRAVAPKWEQLLAEIAESASRDTAGVGSDVATAGAGRVPSSSTAVEEGPAGRGRARASETAGQAPGRLPSQSLEAYARFIRGRDLADEGRYTEALPELEQAVNIDPELALAWSEMGCAYYFTGDAVRSRAAHLKAAAYAESTSRKEQLWIRANEVWVNTENGELYRSKLRDFIDAYPDDRDGYHYMGLSYLALDGPAEEAIPWFEKARAFTPGFFPTTMALVECYRRLMQPERAAEVLRDYLEAPSSSEHGRCRAKELLRELDCTNG